MRSVLLLATVLGLTMASYSPYMNVDMDKLYQMQLLANAIKEYMPAENPYISEEDALLDDEVPYAYWPSLDGLEPEEVPQEDDQEVPKDDDQAVYNDAMYSGPHPRDEEHLEHSTLNGHQSVSGGTADGSEDNEKQVKSDKLPAYCNPPNPCPVGKTSADNCVENFENSAQNNKRLLAQQECSCDTEHMFKCPVGSKTVSTSPGDQGDQTLNKVMGQLAQMEGDNSLENNKRLSVVSKKSPHFLSKRAEGTDYGNPYLKGLIKDMAAKKSPEHSKTRFPDNWDNWNNF